MVTLQRIPSHRSLGARAEAAIGDSADGGDAVRQGRHVTTRANQFTAQGSFTDQCTAFDGARWVRADGWANGSPFDNGWRADHATVAGGLVDLRLDDVSSSGQPDASGEVRTSGYYGYGCYEASFKPVRQIDCRERVLHVRGALRQRWQRPAQRDRRRVPRVRHLARAVQLLHER